MQYLILTIDLGGSGVNSNSSLRYDQKMALNEAKKSPDAIKLKIPAKLIIAKQPSGATETVPFSSQPKLIILDTRDEIVTILGHGVLSGWAATATIKTGSGDTAARLRGSVTVPFVDGWANYTDLSIDGSATGYILEFTTSKPKSAKFSASSQAFDVLKMKEHGQNLEQKDKFPVYIIAIAVVASLLFIIILSVSAYLFLKRKDKVDPVSQTVPNESGIDESATHGTFRRIPGSPYPRTTARERCQSRELLDGQEEAREDDMRIKSSPKSGTQKIKVPQNSNKLLFRITSVLLYEC